MQPGATSINGLQVHLVELSIKHKDAVTVLLTGRGETNFSSIVKRMVDSRGLEFDLICLKPEVGPSGQHFASTIEFKNEFLRSLVFTYRNAEEIRIYEDRAKHVKQFREHFERLNKSLLSHPINQPPPPRKPITADVIQVAELNSYLDSVTETSIIQSTINKHNTAITDGLPNLAQSPHGLMKISSSFIYFGYLINPNDSARLITLANIQPQSLMDSTDVRLMANSILIAPRPPDRQTLDRVGGKGKKLKWQVTGTAVYENKIWAVRVSPVPETERHYTNDRVPVVVLAVRRGARPIDAGRIQRWHPIPPEKAFIFETVVGDKQILRIEADDSGDDSYNSRPNNRGAGSSYHHGGTGGDGGRKRKFGRGSNGYAGGRDTSGGFSTLPKDEGRDVGIRERDDENWIPPDRALGNATGNPGGGRYGDREAERGADSNNNNNNSNRRFFPNSNRGGGGGNRGGYQPSRGGGGGVLGRGGGPGSNNNNTNYNRRYDQSGNYNHSSSQNGNANTNSGSNNYQGGRGQGGGGGAAGAPTMGNRGADRRDRDRDRGPGAGAGAGGRSRAGHGHGHNYNYNHNHRGGPGPGPGPLSSSSYRNADDGTAPQQQQYASYDGANDYRGAYPGGNVGNGGNGGGGNNNGQMIMNY